MTKPRSPRDHGTEVMYSIEGCRCEKCCEARFRRTKRWRARRDAGDVLVDSTQAFAHLDRLTTEGFTRGAVFKLMGWPGGSHSYTRRARIHRRYAAALLDMNRARLLAELPDRALVPRIGAQRRIRALAALGWTADHVTPGSNLARNVLYTGRVQTTAGAHRTIAEAFERLCMTPGPSRSARLRSDGITPIMWDDIDDPAALPWAPGNADEDTDAYETAWMLDQGFGVTEICARLGIKLDSLYKRMQRAGRDDLHERLKATVRRAAA